MSRYAMEAISEDEDAAAAAGVNRHRRKTQDHAGQRANDCARRRALLPVPDVHLAGHRKRHLGVAADGVRRHRRRALCVARPTVGAIITIMLAEILRIGFGTNAVGWDNLVYGVLLVLFIIFLPKGILGSILERLKLRRRSSFPAVASSFETRLAPLLRMRSETEQMSDPRGEERGNAARLEPCGRICRLSLHERQQYTVGVGRRHDNRIVAGDRVRAGHALRRREVVDDKP